MKQTSTRRDQHELYIKSRRWIKLCTHLNFGGDCEEAFRFYEKHLGGKITMMMKKSQLPAQYNVEPGTENDVVHARMNIAGVELIANDVPKSYFKLVRSSYLFLALDSTEDADSVYAVLAEAGEIGMPIAETFFAPRFGQPRDRFGTLWTIIHERPM
jgi:PhnB protein